jgi:hypothetical protein
VIHAPADLDVTFHDFSGHNDPAGAARSVVKRELDTPINATLWPSRITLIRVADQSHWLCINLHHLVTDTWSCMVLQRELPLAYEQARTGALLLPSPGWQFSQFMAWQDCQIAGEGFARHREYWRKQLDGASAPALNMGAWRPRTPRIRASLSGEIDVAVMQTFRAFAAQHRTTVFVVSLSVFYLLLMRMTGQFDLTVCTVFANRTRPEIERTVGFIANLLPLRLEARNVISFSDVIERVRTVVADAIAHQEFPYHLASQGAAASGTVRPDDVVFQMLTQRIDETTRTSLECQGLVPDVGGRFDLEMALMPLEDSISVKLHYAEQRLSKQWATEFLDGYIELARNLAARSTGPLSGSGGLLNR